MRCCGCQHVTKCPMVWVRYASPKAHRGRRGASDVTAPLACHCSTPAAATDPSEKGGVPIFWVRMPVRHPTSPSTRAIECGQLRSATPALRRSHADLRDNRQSCSFSTATCRRTAPCWRGGSLCVLWGTALGLGWGVGGASDRTDLVLPERQPV